MASRFTSLHGGSWKAFAYEPMGSSRSRSQVGWQQTQTMRGGWGHRSPFQQGWRASQETGKEPQVSKPNATKIFKLWNPGSKKVINQRKWWPQPPALKHTLQSLRCVLWRSQAGIRPRLCPADQIPSTLCTGCRPAYLSSCIFLSNSTLRKCLLTTWPNGQVKCHVTLIC